MGTSQHEIGEICAHEQEDETHSAPHGLIGKVRIRSESFAEGSHTGDEILICFWIGNRQLIRESVHFGASLSDRTTIPQTAENSSTVETQRSVLKNLGRDSGRGTQ